MIRFLLLAAVILPVTSASKSAAQSDSANPWWPTSESPPLLTPAWVGEPEVECVVTLGIDDMRDPVRYEAYLRPILQRLKQIDGRAPVSIMTCSVRPEDPRLQSWLDEGLSFEVHTADHPCPVLHSGNIERARETTQKCFEQLLQIPGNVPVAFRTPCCDSLNTVSPRFYAEVFPGVAGGSQRLQIDSSVFQFYTSEDRSIPTELIHDADGRERFLKYMPRDNEYKGLPNDFFVNYIENYPYPYLINDCCWQFPCMAPSDWSAQHLHGVNNLQTVEDWKAALDITVRKKGVFNLVFHPHGWIRAEQVVELIDHAVERHGKKVKFLTFRECAERLSRNLTGGRSVAEADPAVIDRLSCADYRSRHPDRSSLSAAPEAVQELVREAEPEERTKLGLLPLQREDGTHNGFFVRDDYVCWQNEDTSQMPDMLHKVSFEDLLQRSEPKIPPPLVPVGAARIDITPDYPIRLSGYGNRRQEATDVAARIHARALAIGSASGSWHILLTVDNCGVPLSVTTAVHERLAQNHEVPRAAFAVASSHSHSAPWLQGFAPNILTEVTQPHTARLNRYESELIAQLVNVAETAISEARPCRLALSFGEVGFAINRRKIQTGVWQGFGEQDDGPVDHRLPLLSARDADGRLVAVLANYACHATTETGQLNSISGDWPGISCGMIEADYPGAVALISIGTGADSNPSPRGTHELAVQHARTLADEVSRLLSKESEPIDSDIESQYASLSLPYGPLPERRYYEELAGMTDHRAAYGRHFLKMLDAGQELPASVDNYPVVTWCFGDDLAMVFLGGEVVIDYGIRLQQMFDADRLWINAYSNDVPCYIASKRILREGGYEADSSMLYYLRPGRLAPEAEDIICDAVQKLLPHEFYSDRLRADFPAPKSPTESLASIRVRPGLRAELVASEPLIADPVAFDWDTRGRLWVVEMGGYPSSESGGRVRVLQDTDNDGTYDQATTFLDDLPFPTGICMWRHGVVITAAPDVIFAADTDGDLIADQRRTLFTGFAEGNQQHRVNGLSFGLDGWLYLGNGDSGGSVQCVGTVPLSDQELSASVASVGLSGPSSGKPAADIRGRDLRIHPDAGLIDPVSGQTQFGRHRDDFGNWFGNNNSNPIWHYVLDDRQLRRNPHVTVRSAKAEIAVEPGAARVYPASRTLARFNDFDRADRFTSACSTNICRDIVLGKEFHGNAFVCEPVHNLVSRLVLKRDGVTFRAARAEDESDSEFFASTDNWTRPVMVRTGPDGALYIADMYRQVIEHPQWIPEEYQRKLNLRAGSSMGRIWRVVPENGCCAPSALPRDTPEADLQNTAAVNRETNGTSPDLTSDAAELSTRSAMSTQELIGRLSSTNGWWRDTAQRILMHRRSEVRSDDKDGIRRLALQAEFAPVRVQALRTLQGLNDGSEQDQNRLAETVRDLMSDPHAEVRRNAVAVAGSLPSEAAAECLSLVSDDRGQRTAAEQLQLAASLGEVPGAETAGQLVYMLSIDDGDPRIQAAALSSLHADNIGAVVEQMAPALSRRGTAAPFAHVLATAAGLGEQSALQSGLGALLSVAAAEQLPTAELWQAAATSTRLSDGRVSDETVVGGIPFGELQTRADSRALELALSSETAREIRLAALDYLTTRDAGTANNRTEISGLLSADTESSVQQAALRTLAASGDSSAYTGLIQRWPSLTPGLRQDLLRLCLARPSGTQVLLTALEDQTVLPGEIGAEFRQQLLQHRSPDVAKAAAELLAGESTSDRSEIVREMLTGIAELDTDSTRGESVFRVRCSACHRLGGIGKSVGADLTTLTDRSVGSLVTAVLDPNRAVETRFLSYTVVTQKGLTHSGMLLSETGTGLTLLSSDGREVTVNRSEMEELFCSGRSLMPEGLEKDLTQQDLADVIAFVQSAGSAARTGSEPAVVNPDSSGQLVLPADAAVISGPHLVLEEKYRNLGWWQSSEDSAVWTINVPSSGMWTVELDYACDNSSAGNAIRFSTGTRLLTARVPGTGSWDDYRTWSAGMIDLGRGTRTLKVTAAETPRGALIDLRQIRLIPPQ